MHSPPARRSPFSPLTGLFAIDWLTLRLLAAFSTHACRKVTTRPGSKVAWSSSIDSFGTDRRGRRRTRLRLTNTVSYGEGPYRPRLGYDRSDLVYQQAEDTPPRHGVSRPRDIHADTGGGGPEAGRSRTAVCDSDRGRAGRYEGCSNRPNDPVVISNVSFIVDLPSP